MTAAVGCAERARAVQGEAALKEMVARYVGALERASGLSFKRPPVVARRTRAQIVEYARHKLDEELSPAEFRGMESAARMFGLLPESTDLRAAYLGVLGEQIAGFYDPDSATLYVAADVQDSLMLRTTVAHELAHALQHQYTPVDSILHIKRNNDRRQAGLAALEGHATVVQLLVMMPETDRATLRQFSFWEQRSVINLQQQGMKEFAGAPLWLREVLVFPYLAGADFVTWYFATHENGVPFGAALPRSTEQILHTDRYAAGDAPTGLHFSAAGPDSVRFEDDLGEFEIRVLFQELLPDPSGLRAAALAAGWDGDRYQVLRAGADADALVWYSVWDDAAAARRFANSLRRAWPNRRAITGPPRRTTIEEETIAGRPGVRLVDAPVSWLGWSRIPSVQVN